MLKTSVIYFLIRALNGLLALATISTLTRMLSADQYGIYALGMATIALCASVFFQWIAVAVSRFYAMHKAEPDILLVEAYRVFVLVAALGGSVVAIYAAWNPIKSISPLQALTISAGAIAMGMHGLSLQVANASGKPGLYGILTVSRGAFSLGAMIVFIHAGYGGTGAVFGVAVGSAVAVVLFGRLPLNQPSRRNPELRRQMVIYGLPLTLTYLATMVLDVSDRFLIGARLGAAAVAGYAASYDLTQQVVGAAMNVFFLAAYPRIVFSWERDGARGAHQAMLPLFRTFLLGISLVTGLTIGLSPMISEIIYGPAVRADAAEIMPLVAIAITIGCFKSYFLDLAFQLAKVTKMQLRITVIMAVLNVGLNLALMTRFGIKGAAVATAAAFMSGAIASWWFGRKLGIYPDMARSFIKLVLVMASIIFAMRLAPVEDANINFEIIFRLFIGVVTYIIVVLFTDLGGASSWVRNKLAHRFTRGGQ